MEPVGIVSLVGACAGIASKATVTAKRLDDFLKNYRNADKAVTRLATQLQIFAHSVMQLEKSLNSTSSVSENLKSAVGGSLDDCGVIMNEMEDHVEKVRPEGDSTQSMGFSSRIRHVWSKSAINEQEMRLNLQLQTIMQLIQLVKQDDVTKQNNGLEQPSAKKTIAKSARDAIRARPVKTQSARSRPSSILSWSTGKSSFSSADTALDADDEILKSGPYIAHYRSMVLRHMKKGQPTDAKKAPKASKEVDKVDSGPKIPPEMPEVPAVAQEIGRHKRRARKEVLSGAKKANKVEVSHTQMIDLDRGSRANVLQKSHHLPIGHAPTHLTDSAPKMNKHSYEEYLIGRRWETMDHPHLNDSERRELKLHHDERSDWRTRDNNSERSEFEVRHDKRLARRMSDILQSSNTGRKQRRGSEETQSRWPVSHAKKETFPEHETRGRKSMASMHQTPATLKEQRSAQTYIPPLKISVPQISCTFSPTEISVYPEQVGMAGVQEQELIRDLCQACYENNLKWLKYLLGTEALTHINCYKLADDVQAIERHTPLHIAVISGYLGVAELLLKHKPKLEMLDEKGHTPLVCAVQRYREHGQGLEMIELLLGSGADGDVECEPPLLVAAVSDRNMMLARLLCGLTPLPSDYFDSRFLPAAKPAHINHATKSGEVPLLVAVATDQLDMAQFLIAKRADVTLTNTSVQSPASLAIDRVLAGHQDLNIAKIVLSHSEVVTRKRFFVPGLERRHLVQAVQAGNLELVHLLLAHKLSPNGYYESGKTALRTAVGMERLDIVAALIVGGVDVQEPDDTNITPLMEAVERGSLPFVDALVVAGANIQAEGVPAGRTPLLEAVMKGDIVLVKALLKTQNSVRHPGGKSYTLTPLGVASLHGRLGIVKALLDWGVKVDTQIESDWDDLAQWPSKIPCITPGIVECTRLYSFRSHTALHLAARFHPDVVEHLLAKKAAATSVATCSSHANGFIEESGDATCDDVTPLHVALGPCAEMLIAKGDANVFAKDSRGQTPLFWAARDIILPGTANVEAIMANLAAGSAINLRDREGHTPLEVVAREVLRFMQPLARKPQGTVNWAANCFKAYRLVIRTLVQAGASVGRAREMIHEKDLTNDSSRIRRDLGLPSWEVLAALLSELNQYLRCQRGEEGERE